MRSPDSSTPSDISCQAATEPEATTSRCTLRRAASATVTVMEAIGGAAVVPLRLQAATDSNATRRAARR